MLPATVTVDTVNTVTFKLWSYEICLTTEFHLVYAIIATKKLESVKCDDNKTAEK